MLRPASAPETPKNLPKAGLASTSLPSPFAKATPTGASRNTSPIAAGAAGAALLGAASLTCAALASRGVNHHAVCPLESGRTAATISIPGPTAKLSSRGTPSAAPRVNR